MEQENIVQKKRGRKPNSEKNIKNAPKKRGRKPKDKIGTIDNTSKITTEENVILHLPLVNITQENCESVNIQPFDNNSGDFMKVQPVLHQQNTEEFITLKNKDEDFDEIIKKRENELKINTNTNELFLEYVEFRKMELWPKSTSMPCMNCNHSFDNEPFGIPIKIVNNKCYMFGNFCSGSCGAAYNFDTNYDSNAFERYSLMNYIYNNNHPIFIANSKLILKQWGGKYTIEQYREFNRNLKRINVELYPFIASIPTVEETSYDLDISKPVSIDKSKLKKVTNDYRLKRSKPLPDFKNTLESCMNLKFV